MADREDNRRVMTDPRTAASYRAVDAWIANELARQYNQTLAEPVPAELLALLRE